MRICALSDIHGQLCKVAPCDLVLLAGDLAGHYTHGYAGDADDLYGQSQWLHIEFSDWLKSLPCENHAFCFGNHDWIAQKCFSSLPSHFKNHLLHNNSLEMLGLKIWGSPWTLNFYDWAFNSPVENGEEFLDKIWQTIPDDTDIVVVHQPPKDYGDLAPRNERTGSQSLLNRIKQVQPLLVCSGHIHIDAGVRRYDRGNKHPGIIVNASILDEEYKMVREPFYFDLDKEAGTIEIAAR
jgi:Icc-related predicted phosphoesterase